MLSFHDCIVTTNQGTEDTYLNNLELTQERREILLGARLLVRQTLREAFRRETAALLGANNAITPKFFTQGSWSYGTINRPTHVPPQQVDMDDGCYLPMSFARGATPQKAADVFFGIADRALEALVKAQGWKRYDSSKEVCCRVVIDDKSHIDAPLYAIRDEQFALMRKSLTEDTIRFAEAAALAEEDEYPFDWSMVTDEDVLLAQRDGVWKPSNPRKVTDWVNSAVEEAGPQLRRVWREMKGWRDNRFQKGGASSILMMVMIEDGFDEVKGRDDLAMQAAAKAMRERIEDDVLAPWDARENLNTLTDQERREFAKALKELEDEITYCVQGTLANAAIYLKRWQNQCGKYFSKSVSRVKEVSAHETVHAYMAAPAPFTSFRGDNRSA
jgi:hypothetical protein